MPRCDPKHCILTRGALVVLVCASISACATRGTDSELFPYLPLRGECVIYQKVPPEYGEPYVANSNGVFRTATTDEQNRLSGVQIQDLRTAVTVSHDSKSAYRLAIYYALSCKNMRMSLAWYCLLYTSDAADEEDSVDLGGRRIIK